MAQVVAGAAGGAAAWVGVSIGRSRLVLFPSALNQVFVCLPMLWSLPVVLEPPSARWLEEVTEFVVSALMDVSVGDIFGTVAKCPNSEGSVLRQFFGCGMPCRHSSSSTSLPL